MSQEILLLVSLLFSGAAVRFAAGVIVIPNSQPAHQSSGTGNLAPAAQRPHDLDFGIALPRGDYVDVDTHNKETSTEDHLITQTSAMPHHVDYNGSQGDEIGSHGNDGKNGSCQAALHILNRLMHRYNKHNMPGYHGTHVEVELHVQDISAIDELTAEFDADLMFSELWVDPGLNFEHFGACKKNITTDYQFLRTKLWNPNICVVNTKDARIHVSPTENIFVILYENGTVWANYRMRVRGPCDIQLQNFPLDTQTCMLHIESYSYNIEDVRLRWFAGAPITFLREVHLPEFDLIGFNSTIFQEEYPNGNWDRLIASFTFKRRFGFYFLQAYMPTYLVIVISCISFTIDYRSMPARATVGVSSLLAMIFQYGNVVKNLPRVSYVKALDVFMLASTIFVFCTVIELAVVSYISRRQLAEALDRAIDNAEEFSQNRKLSSVPYTIATGDSKNTFSKSSTIISSPEKETLLNGDKLCIPEALSEYLASPVLAQMMLISELEAIFKRAPSKSAGNANKTIAAGLFGVSVNSGNKRHSGKKVSCCWSILDHVWSPDEIDRFSLAVFPTIFILFNASYWAYYCFMSSVTM